MARKHKSAAALSVVSTIILVVLYNEIQSSVLLSLTITMGTISYHLVMRLIVGTVFQLTMHNEADVNKRWYRVGERELAIYDKINVKKWNKRMPTYDNSAFDPKKHSWDEIAQAMCQAELVHEVNILMSFLPIVEGVWFGDYLIFVITSVLAAGYDLAFVMMQRYNRQRIMKLIKRIN